MRRVVSIVRSMKNNPAGYDTLEVDSIQMNRISDADLDSAKDAYFKKDSTHSFWRKKRFWFIGGAILLLVIICAIVLGVVLSRKTTHSVPYIPVNNQTTNTTNSTSRRGLSFASGFEPNGSIPYNISDHFEYIRTPVNDSATPLPVVVTAPAISPDGYCPQAFCVRSGNSSARAEIVKRFYGVRTEMIPQNLTSDYMRYLHADFLTEYWYGISVYLPPDWIYDEEGDMFLQWHSTESVSPPLSIALYGSQLRVEARANSQTPAQMGGFDKYKPEIQVLQFVADGTPMVGTWTDFVVNAYWTPFKDGPRQGNTTIWMNGTVIFHRDGPNCFNDFIGPYFKFGPFKWAWSFGNRGKQIYSPAESRVIFFDEVYLGNASIAGYDDVVAKPAPNFYVAPKPSTKT
eukprot:Sdes_comp18283_c0_seq1m7952